MAAGVRAPACDAEAAGVPAVGGSEGGGMLFLLLSLGLGASFWDPWGRGGGGMLSSASRDLMRSARSWALRGRT